LLGGILLAQLVHIGASYTPLLAAKLQLEPIQFTVWIQLLPTALVILGVIEIFKRLKKTAPKTRSNY